MNAHLLNPDIPSPPKTSAGMRRRSLIHNQKIDNGSRNQQNTYERVTFKSKFLQQVTSQQQYTKNNPPSDQNQKSHLSVHQTPIPDQKTISQPHSRQQYKTSRTITDSSHKKTLFRSVSPKNGRYDRGRRHLISALGLKPRIQNSSKLTSNQISKQILSVDKDPLSGEERVHIKLKNFKRCTTSFNHKTIENNPAYDSHTLDASVRRLSSLGKRSDKSPLSLLRQLTSSQDDLMKEDIVNSVEYKMKNNIHSQYLQTDYFPDWIMKEMHKFETSSMSINANIFKICEKPNKGRTQPEQKAITAYLTQKVNFFKDVEPETLIGISQKIQTLEYEPGQIMIRQGDDGDFLLIVYDGKASILVNDQKIAEAGPNTLIGEAALEYKQRRKATVVAKTKCKCLAIYKNDYDSTVALFKAQQKSQNQRLLRKISVFNEWNLIKLKGFARILNEVTFKAGQTIYDVGSPSEVLYIIKSGKVKLEAIYEIERTNMIPVAHKQREITKTYQIIKKTLQILNHESQFGMEEIVLEMPKRVIRARAMENTICLYCNKQLFEEYSNSEDLSKYKRLVKDYTDFDMEGKTLLNEVENRKFQSNMFLNAVNVNISPSMSNTRSITDAATSHSSLNNRVQYICSQQLQKVTMIKKILKRIKTQKGTASPYKDQSIRQKSLESISSKDDTLSMLDKSLLSKEDYLDASLNYRDASLDDNFYRTDKPKTWQTVMVRKKSIVLNKNDLQYNMFTKPQKQSKHQSDNNLENSNFLEKGVKIRLLTDPI